MLEALKEGLYIGLKIGGAVWGVTICVVLIGVAAMIVGAISGPVQIDDNDNSV